MKKSELKTGMIVECRSGERALVMINTCAGEDCIVFTNNNWTGLGSFSDDLIWHKGEADRTDHTKSVDIMKVYRPGLASSFVDYTSNYSPERGGFYGFKLLWERKEISEMTLAEVCMALGKEIKIVK